MATTRRAIIALVLSNTSKILQRRPYSSSTPALGSSVGAGVLEKASSILAKKQASVQKEISTLERKVPAANDASTRQQLEAMLVAKQVELGYMQHHQHQMKFEHDYDNPTDVHMKRQQFEKLDLPILSRHSAKYKIFEDAFPGEVTPIDILHIKFDNTKEWRTCWGHGIPSNFALYSPEVVIIPQDPDPDALYTLMMVDLDRENLATRSYHEWCHWLITNIPANGSCVVIPGGSSPFLDPAPTDSKSLASPPSTYHHNLSYQPKAPDSEPVIPGNVVFPYVPPHPANSEPGREHRYLFTLMKQPKGEKINVDLKALVSKADAMRSTERTGRPVWRKMLEGDGERRILARERGCLGKTWAFLTRYNLQLTGYGFLRSRWSTLTSQVYNRLRLHEPVYGRLQDNRDLSPHILDRINTATKLATTINQNPGTLDALALKQLNTGLIQHIPYQRLATQRDQTIAELEMEYDAAVKKRAQKEGKSLQQAKADLEAWKSNVKLHRLTVVGAAGMVRAREGIKGADAERAKQTPRYQVV
ncbi:hypothetical protein SeLEV6574_g00473 [Synchytrium endobioticum]|uniref:Phosphatidylethanolamine-binding protein n=1 Tax=Synchytrium endobioticum TaxID=286115 RepID=A0A507DJP3_9FUNG|nr:hypothetical protein SeLEV6574_g00473 [Synchytrium endobioticum]